MKTVAKPLSISLKTVNKEMFIESITTTRGSNSLEYLNDGPWIKLKDPYSLTHEWYSGYTMFDCLIFTLNCFPRLVKFCRGWCVTWSLIFPGLNFIFSHFWKKLSLCFEILNVIYLLFYKMIGLKTHSVHTSKGYCYLLILFSVKNQYCYYYIEFMDYCHCMAGPGIF